MNTPHPNKDEMPPMAVAVWALKGGRLVDRIKWLSVNGFQGVSFLRYIMDYKDQERKEVAAAINSAGLFITYHANVSDKISQTGKLDTDFVGRIIADVTWWQEQTHSVCSCCADPIHVAGENGASTFDYALNRQFLDLLAEGVRKLGIRIGIENAFGGRPAFCAIDDIARFKAMCVPGLGMLLDAGHANIHVRSDGMEGEKEIGAYVGRLPLDVLEVHLHDNRGEKDEHKPLGYGNLDLKALCRALKQVHFTGKFTLEVLEDVLSGKYAADILDSRQTDPILASRDRVREAWSELA